MNKKKYYFVFRIIISSYVLLLLIKRLKRNFTNLKKKGKKIDKYSDLNFLYQFKKIIQLRLLKNKIIID